MPACSLTLPGPAAWQLCVSHYSLQAPRLHTGGIYSWWTVTPQQPLWLHRFPGQCVPMPDRLFHGEIPSQQHVLIPDQSDYYQASREPHVVAILILCPGSIKPFHSFPTLGSPIPILLPEDLHFICFSPWWILKTRELLRIPHCPAFTVTANEAQKAQTQGAEGTKTERVSPGTLENVDLSTFAVIFSYWFVPSAFGGNLSPEEQGMLPGVTNTITVIIQHLGEFQSHTGPHQVFLKQLFLLFYTNIFSMCKPVFGT